MARSRNRRRRGGNPVAAQQPRTEAPRPPVRQARRAEIADEINVGSAFFAARRVPAGRQSDTETTIGTLADIPSLTLYCRNPRCERKVVPMNDALVRKDGLRATCPGCGESLSAATEHGIKEAYMRR